MACPHVTGVIALMLSVNPSLDYDAIVNILAQTANKAVAGMNPFFSFLFFFSINY